MRIIQIAILSLLVTACSTKKVELEVFAHPDYSISAMNSYKWSEEPVALMGSVTGADSQALQQRTMNAVNAMLSSKGYRKAAVGETADVEVSALIGVINRSKYSEHTYTADQWARSATISWSQINDFLQGAVSVVMRDPNDESRTIWQGTAGGRLSNNPNSSKTTLESYVRSIRDALPQAN